MPAELALRDSTRSFHKTAVAWLASAACRPSTYAIDGFSEPSMSCRLAKARLLAINNSFANAFVGGWQLSTNSTIQSGVPQTLYHRYQQCWYQQSTTRSSQLLGGRYRLCGDTPQPAGLHDGTTRLIYRVAAGNLRQCRAEYNDHTAFPVDRYGAGQAFYDALQRKPCRPVPGGSIQRLQPSDLGGAERKHPGWCRHFRERPANAAHQGFGVISTTALPMRQIQLGIKYLF